MMTEQFIITGKITDTEKNYSHDDYWLDDKLSLCFEAEKTSSDGLNEPPRVYDTAQRNEQRDHAVAHGGGGQRDQDKSQISTTHCFESDILFSQQYKQSKQYDESIHQHEKPLRNLLINLPPLLTPSSSSSSSDIFQHRTHESNCSTTQQEADMGISDMFGLGLPRGSLVNQQIGGSHSRQHQQQHVLKHNHGPSTSSAYNYQQVDDDNRSCSMQSIVDIPSRPPSTSRSPKTLANVYSIKKKSLFKLLFLFTLLSCGQPCRTLPLNVKSPIETSTSAVFCKCDLLATNDTLPKNNTPVDNRYLKLQNEVIDSNMINYVLMITSCICTAYCTWIKYKHIYRSQLPVKVTVQDWTPFIASLSMVFSLILQIIYEINQGWYLGWFTFYTLQTEFYCTTFLLIIKYSVHSEKASYKRWRESFMNLSLWKLVLLLFAVMSGAYGVWLKFITAIANAVITCLTFYNDYKKGNYNVEKSWRMLIFLLIRLRVSVGVLFLTWHDFFATQPGSYIIPSFVAIMGITRGIVFLIVCEHTQNVQVRHGLEEIREEMDMGFDRGALNRRALNPRGRNQGGRNQGGRNQGGRNQGGRNRGGRNGRRRNVCRS